MSDVIVVGGGASGCVVASRLAEAGSRSVLLLEAGPDLRASTPDALTDGWNIAPREFDWGFESEPNPRGNTQNVWRTKALGGTSWLTRFAPRGHPADYDEWPEGWSFEEVIPYFTRLECDADFGSEPWHGDSGPMPVRRYLDREYSEIGAAGLRALEATGFPAIDDHNRPGAVGVGRMPMSSTAGRRVTTVDAYLPLGGTPANLTIRADAPVARVLFDGTAVRGVELVDGGTVEAGHVVLCAGVYGNPPILMRSGVGPADHLRSMGIEVRADLPGVGANLADHPVVDIEAAYSGPAGPMHWIATFHADGTSAESPPDLMIWSGDAEEDGFFASVVLLKPLSRGLIRLRSADPCDPPHIELPALSAAEDIERMVEGYERAFELLNHEEMRTRCDVSGPVADPVAHIRAEARSLPHVVGTCAMGTVVDPSGRVHGTDGLTIADASIMPDVPSGFTHLPAIMLAERLSERIAAAV